MADGPMKDQKPTTLKYIPRDETKRVNESNIKSSQSHSYHRVAIAAECPKVQPLIYKIPMMYSPLTLICGFAIRWLR